MSVVRTEHRRGWIWETPRRYIEIGVAQIADWILIYRIWRLATNGRCVLISRWRLMIYHFFVPVRERRFSGFRELTK